MSYQEKSSFVSLFSSILIFTACGIYVYQKYIDGSLNSENVFKFYGGVFIFLIIVGVVNSIVRNVVLNIISAKDKEPSFIDERDKIIELKATAIAHYVFITGFGISMATLVFDVPPLTMFPILFFFGFSASIIADIFKIYLYRKGF
ncbi:hypothetical protein [Chengkuizengella axinellae]|uniref:DUF2178 domain-containing protein n=1 Tax=Chengkuizengella axinellae TaxID=3064388 RepID=A0ABT9J6D2_9BACL|nr:hypothetical protein [Chengkuizengella sp. 2205SS18-9]MDP5277192.1 hypothetical protein [Chengkuizengella sp. 2205SS18-9]